MLVDLHLLGPFEVRSGHGRLNVGGASQQALLAVLALDVGRAVPFERLAGVLWEGRPPASYRQQLYKRVHALRSVLGADAIATEESGYRLDLAPACSDLHRFSEQVARARRAQSEGRFSEALELFHKALSTWQHPALDGIESQILRTEAAQLDKKRALIVKECQDLEQKPNSPESASRPPPACLPMDMPSFTGRSFELAALDREPNRVVITTITGTAGVGKTALAVHWAHRARHLFPDGQLYVNLRGFDRSAPMAPGEALTMFLRELGAPSERIPPDTDAQSLLFRSMADGKRLLVVLDNAATMEQVEPLLPGSPGCMVLVTSRNALTGLVALHDASRIPLDTLTADESSELLRRILGSHDPAAAARLADLCGHLPLALRIAAATIASSHHTSIADLVDRLSSPDRLTHLKIDGVPRASVAAAFDLSYRAVRQETQELLRLLSIAPGPDITPDAASALCGAPADDLLTELEAMHLVERYRPGRYRLHDLIRLYARNLCATSETVTALLTFYVHSTDAATAAISAVRQITPRPFGTARAREFSAAQGALDWLSSERENLVASAMWAHEHGEDVLCVHLVDALRGFFWVQRRKSDWLAVGELGLASARRLADPAMEALMHRTLGRAHIALERLDDALSHSLTAMKLWEQAQDREAAAHMRLDVSLVYRANCRLDLAATHASQALDYARAHGREDLEVAALNALFDCEMGLGRLDWTVNTATRSLESPATKADKQLQAHAYAARGWAFHEMGKLPEAKQDLAASVDLHDRCGNRESGVLQRAYLGRVHLDAGDHEQSVRLLEYARDELRDLVPHWECVAVHGLALASFRRDDLAEALRLELDAVDIARTRDFPPALIEALVGLGRIRLALGDAADATAFAAEAIDLSVQHGWRLHLGEAHHVLAEASLAAGRTDEARTHATTALDLHRTIGQRLREEENLALLARIPLP